MARTGRVVGLRGHGKLLPPVCTRVLSSDPRVNFRNG